MAAPPSKPSSPSQQPVTESETPIPSVKGENQAQAPEQEPQQPSEQQHEEQIPTYEQVEESEEYQLAKSLLQEGEFEQALNVTEQGIIKIKQLLPEDEQDEIMHESLAPFHYLYGTILLYSIEESSSDAMTTTAVASAAEEERPADAEDHDAADDMEIAWENLEAARAIVENMLRTRADSNESNSKLHLDLAQIYLRAGDLQRMNGRYQAAVDDYTACLQHRSRFLGKYDRKIADVHYNLALSHQLLVAELANASEQQKQHDKESAVEVASQQAKSRSASFQHYLECCKTLCGQIAIMCGQHAEQFLQDVEDQMPRFKSTGEEEEDGNVSSQLCSIKLSAYRKAVIELQPPEVFQNEYNELNELLVEIQETVDEAENSEKGVKEVTDMKSQISAAIAQAAAAEEAAEAAAAAAQGEDGGTVPVTSTTSIGFGSAAATATTAAAQPIMAVRKKKKRDDDDGTPTQADDDNAKRPRAAE